MSIKTVRFGIVIFHFLISLLLFSCNKMCPKHNGRENIARQGKSLGQISSSEQNELHSLKIEPVGTWSLSTNNQLSISVSGLAEPCLLIISFNPDHHWIYSTPIPLIPNSIFLYGIPIVIRLENDGIYELNFAPEAFSVTRWFGQGEHELPNWRIAAYVSQRLCIETMPDPGVKKIGIPVTLSTNDVPERFNIVSASKETNWKNLIFPSEVLYIEGGAFYWIPKDRVIAKTSFFPIFIH